MSAKEFFSLLQFGGAALTLLIAFNKLQGRELSDAEKAVAFIGVATAVGPSVVRGLQ